MILGVRKREDKVPEVAARWLLRIRPHVVPNDQYFCFLFCITFRM
jgi:hypothetical protein